MQENKRKDEPDARQALRMGSEIVRPVIFLGLKMSKDGWVLGPEIGNDLQLMGAPGNCLCREARREMSPALAQLYIMCTNYYLILFEIFVFGPIQNTNYLVRRVVRAVMGYTRHMASHGVTPRHGRHTSSRTVTLRHAASRWEA